MIRNSPAGGFCRKNNTILHWWNLWYCATCWQSLSIIVFMICTYIILWILNWPPNKLGRILSNSYQVLRKFSVFEIMSQSQIYLFYFIFTKETSLTWSNQSTGALVKPEPNLSLSSKLSWRNKFLIWNETKLYICWQICWSLIRWQSNDRQRWE